MPRSGSENLLRIFSLLGLMMWGVANASVDPLPFADAGQEARFKALVQELRCPKCQNQAIGSSDAPIAQDMRRKVHALMVAGETDEGIIGWLEARYGSFIRYTPQFGGATLWLWLIPPLLLLVGGLIGLRFLRSKQVLTDDDRRAADQLLDADA